MANEDLSQIPQAVLNVFGRVRSVRQVADANHVETVELMEERHVERAVVGAQTDEPVRGKKGTPFVIVVERKVLKPRYQAQPGGR